MVFTYFTECLTGSSEGFQNKAVVSAILFLLIHKRRKMDDNNKSKEQLIRELEELRLEIESLKSALSFTDRIDTTTEIPELAREVLSEIEKPYQDLFEHSRDTIFSVSLQGDMVFINPAFESITGWNVQEWIGKPFIGLLHPEDVASALGRFSEVLAGQTSQGTELRIKKKNGDYVYGDFLASPWKIKGEICGLLGIARDITERKRSQQELNESERRFEQLADASFEGIAISDGGIIINANNQLSRMLGYTGEELIGMNVMKMVAPHSLELVLKNIQSGFEGPYEHDAVRKDGQVFPVEIHARLVPFKGRNARVTAIRDVTERKQAENSLREREEWFRNLFEQSSDGIFYMTLEGRIVDVNSSFAEMHGFSLDELHKMNIGDLDSMESKQEFSERVNRMKKGEKLKFEVEHFHKAGHRFPLEVTTGIIKMGSETYIIASHRDITISKRVAESLRISEENFRILFDENPLPTVLSEIPSGVITFANRKLAALLGMNPSDVCGKTAYDLGLLRNQEDLESLTRLITKKGFVDNLEVEKLFPEGQPGTDLVFMRIVMINGKQHCLTVIQDITDRKRQRRPF
jgi:PAS domain S-box-containing protein